MNAADARSLDLLLEETPAAAERRERAALDQEVEGCSGLVLFGCGQLGRKLARALQSAGRPVLAFADNSEGKWGTVVEGLPVLSPREAAARYGDRAAFVATIWSSRHRFLDTRAQLEALGCRRILSFMLVLWAYPGILPHYQFERPSVLLSQAERIRAGFSLWADEVSRSHFLSHLRWRLNLDFAGLPTPTPKDQYFVEGLLPERPGGLFVDGGAYDGDTLQLMRACRGDGFGRYLAIEPDPVNFSKLQAYWETLPAEVRARVELIPAALSDRDGEAAFDAVGATRAALTEDGSTRVRTVALDGLLPPEGRWYIKLDLEGGERLALEGGRDHIRRAAPDLAVCVYHRPFDLWELPLLVHRWQPGYRFHLRTHDEEGLEIVAYATTGV
ncbi:MAG: methyltransferase FkbM family [Holophagaceae bacterium]|nr:methyltransferase FkbM family [Holophagaceae bacterium]